MQGQAVISMAFFRSAAAAIGATISLTVVAVQSIVQVQSLSEPTMNHSATLLSDGKVLVVAPSGRSDLFDPLTNTWSQTGSMAQGSHEHTALRLANGKVLVVGGYVLSTTAGAVGNFPIAATLSRAEIFDPQTGSWSNTGSLSSSRAFNSLNLFPDGSVVVIGGQTNAASSSTAGDYIERYTPASGTWSVVGSLPEARSAHATTALAGGTLLVLGGRSTTAQRTTNCWRIDPRTYATSVCAEMSVARAEHSVTRLFGGSIYVAGGTVPGAAFETIYDPVADTWTSTVVAETAGIARRFQIERNANSVLSVVGADYAPYSIIGELPQFSAKVLRYFPSTSQLSTVGSIGVASPSQTQLNDGRILVVGGYDSYRGFCSLGCFFYPNPSAKAYTIDRATISLIVFGEALPPYAPALGERYHVPVFRSSAVSAIAPTGVVAVSDGSALCIGNLSGYGCVLTTEIAGPKQYTVSYAGDSEYLPSQIVVQRPPGDRLRVERVGSPIGTIRYSPVLYEGIASALGCGVASGSPFVSSCDPEFRTQESVVLTANPDGAAEGVFVGWQGVCAGSASTCVVAKPVSGSVVVRAVFAPAASLPFKLDIDANDVVNAATDGQLIRRFMNRVHDGALTQSALGNNPQRTSSDEIEDRLNTMTPLLDVDQNGRADALTDGVIILRFLLGFRDDPLIQNAIGEGARRTDPTQIAAHLQAMMP